MTSTTNEITNSSAGGTNYKGQIIFAGEGQGDRIASALYLMNPLEPYNTTGRLSDIPRVSYQANFVTDPDYSAC